ncbi:MAG: DinB family protein [Chitinophagaceae bacterium]|nr:DinB family protein [Chitinophagaceae bacterium]
MLQASIQQLGQIISDHAARLYKISNEDFSFKRLPHKWSKKEILGHLIDSAQNNIRRFVVAQYEELPKIVYNQDKWVAAADYQGYPVKDLIDLWVLLNKHICTVLMNISPGAEKREAMSEALHSIEWLAADYSKHLLHHLHQVLDLPPVAYP